MKHRLLLDTNILLDFALTERKARIPAVMVMQEIEMAEAEGFICATSLKDIYFVMCKYVGEEAAREFTAAALQFFEVLPINKATCLNAIKSDEPDFEDGLIRECAEAAGVDFIISRDKEAFKKSKVKCLSAQEYLNIYIPRKEVSLGE